MKTLQLVNWSTPPKLIIVIYYEYLKEYQLTCLMNLWIKLMHHLQIPKNGINIAKTLIWKNWKINKAPSDRIPPSDMDLKQT